MVGNLRRQLGHRMAVWNVREQTKARATLASVSNPTYYVFIWNSKNSQTEQQNCMCEYLGMEQEYSVRVYKIVMTGCTVSVT